MKQSILIVDDEYGLADVLADILTERNYDVRIAINGQLGLEALEEHLADVVLLDVMMPEMDGPEMLKAMRARPELAKIPVILMTALPNIVPPDCHADAVLAKPFATAQLMEALSRFLPPQKP